MWLNAAMIAALQQFVLKFSSGDILLNIADATGYDHDNVTVSMPNMVQSFDIVMKSAEIHNFAVVKHVCRVVHLESGMFPAVVVLSNGNFPEKYPNKTAHWLYLAFHWRHGQYSHQQ